MRVMTTWQLDTWHTVCCMQVWVVPELRADGKIYWRADSDSQLTKVGCGTKRGQSQREP